MGSFPQASISASTILLIGADLEPWADAVRSFSASYTVRTLSSCTKGFNTCRHEGVDCVLLDLDMPDVGFRGLVELVPNPKHPLIAVVVLTHLVHPALRDIAVANGAYTLLVKHQLSAKELEVTIQQAIASVKFVLL